MAKPQYKECSLLMRWGAYEGLGYEMGAPPGEGLQFFEVCPVLDVSLISLIS